MKFILEAKKNVDGDEETATLIEALEQAAHRLEMDNITINTRYDPQDLEEGGELPGFRAWLLEPNACVDRWGEPYRVLVRLQDGRDVYVLVHSPFTQELEEAIQGDVDEDDFYISGNGGWRAPTQAPGLMSNLDHDTITIVMQGEDPVREVPAAKHSKNEGNL